MGATPPKDSNRTKGNNRTRRSHPQNKRIGQGPSQVHAHI